MKSSTMKMSVAPFAKASNAENRAIAVDDDLLNAAQGVGREQQALMEQPLPNKCHTKKC